jgi:hypothetical protein
MKAGITLCDPEESLAVEIDARDRRAWEVKGRKACGLPAGPLRDVIREAPETYVAWIAWHAAAVRGGRKDLGDFAAFDARLAEVSDFDAGEDELLGDPTGPAT